MDYDPKIFCVGAYEMRSDVNLPRNAFLPYCLERLVQSLFQSFR